MRSELFIPVQAKREKGSKFNQKTDIHQYTKYLQIEVAIWDSLMKQIMKPFNLGPIGNKSFFNKIYYTVKFEVKLFDLETNARLIGE